MTNYSYAKFVRHILLVGSTDILVVLQSLIFLPLITKLLGAADYGIWSQLKITISFLSPFIFLGLNGALLRFVPGANETDKKEGVFSSIAFISLISVFVSCLLIFFKAPLSLVFNFNHEYVSFLAILIFVESLSVVLLVIFRALHRMSAYFWFVSSKIIAEAAFVTALLLMGSGLKEVLYSILAMRVILIALEMSYLVKVIGFSWPRFTFLKKYLSFGFPTIFDDISYWIVASADRYLIGFFMGIIFVGYYAPAYSLAALLAFFLFPLSGVLSAVLPKLYDEGNLNQVRQYLAHSVKYFLLLVIPAAFGLSILSKELLVLFSTKEISDQSFFVVPFVAFSMLAYGMTYFFSQVLVLRKKTKIIAMVWFSSAILNVALNFFLIPVMGIMAAALATLASYIVALLLIGYLALREFSIPIDNYFIFKVFMISLAMSFLLYWLSPEGILGMAWAIVLGVMAYFVLMILSKSIGKKELSFLRQLLNY